MKIRLSCFLFLSVSFIISSCNSSADKGKTISFDKYQIAAGFEIQLVAAEPMIAAPVAMDFDNQNRIWVVEMRGYMPNIMGKGDTVPNGRISILEDFDENGRALHAKVFIDSLVLPRALALVYGGLLYAVPPNLWFVEIKNDKPGKRTLVDSTYAVGGSPEGQANGLMMNIDNWIYSANSHFRYQLKEGKWIKEPTSFRGQFGITKDNFGRLYYNYNQIQIAGDYVLPNSIIANPYLKPEETVNIILTDNQRVYPLHPTTVNRGYKKGVLNEDSLLLEFTAACGPLIYRGGQFPDEYSQNVFVCEPQANLVKRDILNFDGVKITAKQAWDDKEFLASTDEGFRPVNLSNGPDGALYIVDMHRGVLEYAAFSTPYYNNSITAKKLDTLLQKGRIIRVKSKNMKLEKVPLLCKASATELVGLLKSRNGWIRDRAQQLIIYKQQRTVIPELETLAQEDKNAISAIHALRTLDGLDALSFDFLKNVTAIGNPMLTAHSLLLLEEYSSGDNIEPMAELTKGLLKKNDAVINLYLALSLGSWAKIAPDAFLPVLMEISKKYSDDTVYQEAVISSIGGMEEDFQRLFNNLSVNEGANALLDSLLNQTIANRKNGKMNSIYVQAAVPIDSRTNGFVIYKNTCATCHGMDGNGIEYVAPPLRGSEYVEGAPDRLAMIILNGLEGPVHINGKLYNFNGSMPGFRNKYTDRQIADIIKYLHNAYVTKPAESLNAEDIKKIRNNRVLPLTENDLLQMNNPGK